MPALLVLLALILAACVSENRPADCEAEAKTIEVTVTSDAMTPNDPAACEGQAVTLIISAELDAVFHVHGLDDVLPADNVAAGRELRIQFTANRSGQFPIEIHPDDDPRGVSVGILTIHER